MPHRRLSRRLLHKLRFHAMRIRGAFGQFRNIDMRGINEENPHEQFPRGQRVREIDLHKTSMIPVALKWVHNATARQTVERIFAVVKGHNHLHQPKEYRLLMPKAYVIDQHIVAMSKEDYPTLEEVLEFKSDRAKRAIAKMSMYPGFSFKKLGGIAPVVTARTGIRPDNILLVRYKRGKFIFVPLIDLF